MTKPLVSVIIPCYNAAAYVTEAINSVLKQTYQNIEIIVINDGSTDNTEEKILALNNAKIRYYKQANKGQSTASNYGWSNASGEYIKFFDADDIMHPHHIEAQLNILNGKNTALSFCSWARFYNDEPDSARFFPERNWQSMKPLEWIKTAMSSKYDMMPGWGWLIPRQLLEKAGGWNEDLSLNNDFEFSVRLVLHASYVHFSSDAIIYYRSGQNLSLSALKSLEAFKAALHSANLGCSLLLQKENTAYTRRLCANKLSYWLYHIYPEYPDLVWELEKKIKSLGGTDRKLDESPVMHFLQETVGWKLAKQIKLLAHRIGFGKFLRKMKKIWFSSGSSRREKGKLTISNYSVFTLSEKNNSFHHGDKSKKNSSSIPHSLK